MMGDTRAAPPRSQPPIMHTMIGLQRLTCSMCARARTRQGAPPAGVGGGAWPTLPPTSEGAGRTVREMGCCVECFSAAPLPSRARLAIRAYERARPWRQRARVSGYPWPFVSRPSPTHHWAGGKARQTRQVHHRLGVERVEWRLVVPLHVVGAHNAQLGTGSATQKCLFSAAPFPEETAGLLPEASV